MSKRLEDYLAELTLERLAKVEAMAEELKAQEELYRREGVMCWKISSKKQKAVYAQPDMKGGVEKLTISFADAEDNCLDEDSVRIVTGLSDYYLPIRDLPELIKFLQEVVDKNL